MQSIALGVFVLTFLSAHALAQGPSLLASSAPQEDTIPSETSYGTITNGPECTGCLLEAIHPTQLSFPDTVYCLNITFISTVPSAIVYTHVAPDGCTSPITELYTPQPPGPISTTSITWDLNGTCLTWPTTYVAYSSFQAGTWTHCGCDTSDCTMHPTTVTAQNPIIYPTTGVQENLSSIPSQVVESIIHDPSISIPFNISTCTANSAQPGLYIPDTTAPPSCIQLPPITSIIPNTFSFVHSTGYKSQATTPPSGLHAALNGIGAANVAAQLMHEQTYISVVTIGVAHGGEFRSPSASGSANASTTAPTSRTTNSTSTSTSSRTPSFHQ